MSDDDVAKARQVMESMSMRERVAQLCMPVVKMFDVDSAKIEIDRYVGELQVGGILFYKGACADQIALYNRAAAQAKRPLMVAIDGEWGLNMRLRNTPRFPVNMAIGAVQNLDLVGAYGAEMGRQCRRMGINVNFAPSVDVNSNPDNPVIGRRAYGDDKNAVAERGIAYALGLESAGVLSCAKHFPGHGDTNQDSHKTLPTVGRTANDIRDIDLFPFARYIDSGLNGVMVAHLNVPALDSVTSLCTSLSPVVVNGVLRQKMGFKGLVFTDALDMQGVTKFGDTEVKALLAGNDVLVMPIDVAACIDGILEALTQGRIDAECINQHCLRVLAYKEALHLSNNAIDPDNILNDLNTARCRELILRLAQESVTLVSDGANLAGKVDARHATLLSLGDDENLKLLSLGDTVVTAREFYRHIDEAFGTVLSYNSKSEALPHINGEGTLVIEVFSAKPRYVDALKQLVQRGDVAVVFYLTPYDMLKFKPALASAQTTVVCAYEDTFEAQMAAQEALQGKIAFRGKLPVSLPLP
ncbi:MAG: glycoside hydrolase family 3 protein [Muribaculaceae bacterium]